MFTAAPSEARLRANRTNASKSTGPKTEPGKASSRSNALGHGLASRGAVVPVGMEEDVAARHEEWRRGYQDLDAEADGVLRQAAIDSLKLEQIDRQREAIRATAMLRAQLSWDDDRTAEAHELGRHLADDPVSIKNRLEQTPQGCRWLIDRWRELARASQESLSIAPNPNLYPRAFDLLGVSPDARPARPSLEGETALHRIADREIARLHARADGDLARLDQMARQTAQTGLDVIDTRAMRLLDRYDREIRRRLRDALYWLAPLALPAVAPEPEPVAAPKPATSTTALHRNEATCQNDTRPRAVATTTPGPISRFAGPISRPDLSARAVPAPCPSVTG